MDIEVSQEDSNYMYDLVRRIVDEVGPRMPCSPQELAGAQIIKAELEKLVAQLNEALQKVPPEKAEDAEAVAEMTKSLIDTASAEKPNKTMIQITGEGLKQAAKNIADVMPTVLSIATQIVTTIAMFAV